MSEHAGDFGSPFDPCAASASGGPPPRSRRLVSVVALVLVLVAGGLTGCGTTREAWTPSGPVATVDHSRHALSTIATGSCAVQGNPQPVWEAVLARDPDLYLALGDNIYGDTEDVNVLRRKYARLAADEGFAELRRTTPIEAIWDDHDFGENDAGRHYPMRDSSEDVFLEFWNVPDTSSRWGRPGIYGATTYGSEGRRVQVILLDTRYFRDSLARWADGERPEESGPYRPWRDTTRTLLGDRQWAWLARQLEKPAELRIVASSIQVVSDRHGWEMWGNFPHERERLFRLLREKEANGVIFLSGDRHAAEISRYRPSGDEGYPLYDLTASALNQTGGAPNEVNPYRTHDQKYIEPNFGLIQVDWQQEDPTIRLQIRSEEGEIVREERLTLSTISPY